MSLKVTVLELVFLSSRAHCCTPASICLKLLMHAVLAALARVRI